MSRARMDFDDPAAGVALTAKGDLDAERPQRCLHAPQATGERPGISGPDGAIRANSVPPVSGAGPEQVGGAAHPRAALGHDFAHAGGHRVGVDGIYDRRPAIGRIGPREGAGGPQAGFAGRRPAREIGHPREPIEASLRQRTFA
jgi:hypothetical protein